MIWISCRYSSTYEEDINLDFRIIETVESEELFDGQLLYIPEEYPENCDEYYSAYKNDNNNILFARNIWFCCDARPKNNLKKDFCLFLFGKNGKMLRMDLQQLVHIHGRNTYGKKIFFILVRSLVGIMVNVLIRDLLIMNMIQKN